MSKRTEKLIRQINQCACLPSPDYSIIVDSTPASQLRRVGYRRVGYHPRTNQPVWEKRILMCHTCQKGLADRLSHQAQALLYAPI